MLCCFPDRRVVPGSGSQFPPSWLECSLLVLFQLTYWTIKNEKLKLGSWEYWSTMAERSVHAHWHSNMLKSIIGSNSSRLLKRYLMCTQCRSTHLLFVINMHELCEQRLQNYKWNYNIWTVCSFSFSYCSLVTIFHLHNPDSTLLVWKFELLHQLQDFCKIRSLVSLSTTSFTKLF